MAIDGASECLIACSNLTQLATLWRVQMNKLVTVYYNQSLDTALAALYNDKLGRDYGKTGLSFGHPSSSLATVLQGTREFAIYSDSGVTMTSFCKITFDLESGRNFMPHIVLIESTLNFKTISFDHSRNN